MILRLVGTVTITGNGRSVPIKAPKVAGVLATLASRPGTVIGQLELIDRIWGSNPPETALNVLYTYIARLRSMLKSVPGVRIDRASRQAYRLDISPDDIDVHRIRSLSAEAARLRQAGESAEALGLLRDACRLADGTALHGVPGEWAAAFRQSFARERLGILTERFHMELAQGHHAAVVDELAGLVLEEPLAEPLVGQLMLAYYRCGRPADALESFETLRTRLRDELGADPSQDLRQLHVQVLDQDPTLTAEPGPDVAAAARPTPAQLPADTAAFTGRTGELARLAELADTGHRLATVVGVGGVGKTSLATHWGHANRHRFGDGQIYLNLRGFDHGEPVAAREALARLLTALGYDGAAIPDDVEAAAELYRSATADLDLLVILDNARDTRQVRPLLPGSGAFTIVTSRDRLTGLTVRDDAQPIRLSTLDSSESAALLARLVDESDPATALRLADLCGNLPLALRIAAARIREEPSGITGYTDDLARNDRLSLLTVDDDTESAVGANLDLSYRNLSSNAQSVFCRIGSLPGEDVSTELANEISGLSEVETDRAVRQLLSGHLLEQHQSGRYRMHDLVRLYAAERARSELTDTEQDETINRFIEWHHDRAYQDVRDEEANILAAAETLVDHPRLWRLAHAMRHSLDLSRNLERAQEIITTALRNAETTGDERGTARMNSMLVAIAYRDGDVQRATELGRQLVQQSVRLETRPQIMANGNLGMSLRLAGHTRSATRHLTHAVELAMEAGITSSLRIFGANLVTFLCEQSEVDAAAARLAAVHGAGRGEWTPPDELRFGVVATEILTAQGRFEAALTAIDEIIETAQKQQAFYHVASSTSERANILYHAGWSELALQANQSELDMLQAHAMTGLKRRAQFHRARILADLGEFSEAMAIVNDICDKGPIRSPYYQAQLDLIRSTAHNGLGDTDAAMEYAWRSSRAFAEMALPWLHEAALITLAGTAYRLGDVTTAREANAEAETIGAPVNNGRRAMMRRGVEDLLEASTAEAP